MDKRKQKGRLLGIKLMMSFLLGSIGVTSFSEAAYQETNILEQSIEIGTLSIVGDGVYTITDGVNLYLGNECLDSRCYYQPILDPYNMPIDIEISQTDGLTNTTYVTIKKLKVRFSMKNEGTLPAKYTIKENGNALPHKSSYLQVATNEWSSTKGIRTYDVWVNKPEGGRDRLNAMEYKNQNIILPGQSIACDIELPLDTSKKLRIDEILLEAQVCIQFKMLSKNGWEDDTCNSIAIRRSITQDEVNQKVINEEVIDEDDRGGATNLEDEVEEQATY